MGSTHSLELLQIGKSIWRYLLSYGIIITAAYLPSKLNIQADWEFPNSRDPSDWKLHQIIYRGIIKHFGYPTADLFSSRLCHQLPQYVAWKPYPNIIDKDEMQQCRNKMFPDAFSPFSLVFEKGPSRKGITNDNSYTNMANTTFC